LRSGRRHYRLKVSDALSAHERALKTGGLPGIRQISLVESAIARPYSGYHRTIAQKAAALVESVSGNHGFTDGNKRTTLILTHLLLSKSGYRLVLVQSDASIDVVLEELILAVVCHERTFDQIVRWFNERLQRL
jgi:death-on-curing protein